MTSTCIASSFFKTQFETSTREVFCVALLDGQHRLIDSVELFTGTVNAASVYPRVVVELVLKNNACSVIFAHNHPSGVVKESQADITITNRLQKALELIDVSVLDHIIVGSEGFTSFAERGLL
nr:JAB domain-containing protein [Thalassotalea marina]